MVTLQVTSYLQVAFAFSLVWLLSITRMPFITFSDPAGVLVDCWSRGGCPPSSWAWMAHLVKELPW